MATLVKLGPTDHGRPMTLAEFLAGDYREGYTTRLLPGFELAAATIWERSLCARWCSRQPETIA